MPVANIVQQKVPNSSPWYHLTAHQTTNTSKVKRIGPQSFASSAIFNLSPTDRHFFNHLNNFLQRKGFSNQQNTEDAFQEFLKSQSRDFYATGINKPISCYFLLAKKKKKKDELEPSYKDLKFRVWNHSYFFVLFCFVFLCSVIELSPTLCDPMDYSMSDFSVVHYLLEFAQTHVRWVSDAT